MPGNTFGSLFRVTTFGESHGAGIGAIIDGCPPNIKISEKKIIEDLARRRPGSSKLTTPRNEADMPEILSGIFDGKTTGTPIGILIKNKDQQSKDYDHLKNIYRPSHADFTYTEKYGNRDYRGGGRSSARETAMRVAAGAIARQILATKKIDIVAYTKQIYDIYGDISDPGKVTRKATDKNAVRCPDKSAAEKMEEAILRAKKDGDSLGGIIECVIKNVPTGIGEPVFDRLEAKLAHAMLSIPATKGFEIGSGFNSVYRKGSEHNDPFEMKDGKVATTTNNSGGVQGGISNGMDIIFRIAFKPTATIQTAQKTVTKKHKTTTLEAKGRHDPCVIPRAIPIVEAMAALVVTDLMLQQNAITDL